MTSDPVILGLETATLGGSVFLGRGESQLAARQGNPQVSHSNSLLSDIDGCLDDAGLKLQDVDLLACASGPGSFTGLRIGIATLKGLATALERDCAGVPTLQALAHAAGHSSATVAILPAGRGEFFAQMFSVSSHDVVSEIDAAAHLSPQRLLDKYGALANVIWASLSTDSHHAFLNNYAQQQGISFRHITSDEVGRFDPKPGWTIVETKGNLARHVAILALQAFHDGRIQSPHSLGALYVRPSDAELKEQCR